MKTKRIVNIVNKVLCKFVVPTIEQRTILTFGAGTIDGGVGG